MFFIKYRNQGKNDSRDYGSGLVGECLPSIGEDLSVSPSTLEVTLKKSTQVKATVKTECVGSQCSWVEVQSPGFPSSKIWSAKCSPVGWMEEASEATTSQPHPSSCPLLCRWGWTGQATPIKSADSDRSPFPLGLSSTKSLLHPLSQVHRYLGH